MKGEGCETAPGSPLNSPKTDDGGSSCSPNPTDPQVQSRPGLQPPSSLVLGSLSLAKNVFAR